MSQSQPLFTLETLQAALAANDTLERAPLELGATKETIHVLYDFDQEYIKEIQGIIPVGSDILMRRAFSHSGNLIIPHDFNQMGHPKVLRMYKNNFKLDFNLKIAAYAVKYSITTIDYPLLSKLLAYFQKTLFDLVPKYQMNHPDQFLHWRFRSEAQIHSKEKGFDPTKYQKEEYWVLFNSKVMGEFGKGKGDENGCNNNDNEDEFNYTRINQNLYADFAASRDEKNHAEWAFELLDAIKDLGIPKIVGPYFKNIWRILCLIPKTALRAAKEFPDGLLDIDGEDGSYRHDWIKKPRVVETLLRVLYTLEVNAYIYQNDDIPVLTLGEANRILSVRGWAQVSPYLFNFDCHENIIRPKCERFLPLGQIGLPEFKRNLALLTGDLFVKISLKEFNAYLTGSTFFACAYPHLTRGNFRKMDSYILDRYGDVDLDITVRDPESLAQLLAKLQATYPGTLKVRGKNAQHLEYYAELPQKKVKIDMFLFQTTPAAMVNKFHLGCVRGYWDGEEAYVLPSFIMTQFLNYSPDIRSNFDDKLVQIIDKYYDRGVGVFLNAVEIEELKKHTELEHYKEMLGDHEREYRDRSHSIWQKLKKGKVDTIKSLHKDLKKPEK